MRYFPLLVCVSVLSMIGLTATGCSDNSTALAPFEPEVSNVPDSFSMQATGVVGVTTTVTYTWSNSATRASINHSTTVDAGSASLVVKDDAGTIVYDKDLEPSLNEPTAVGVAGNWTIEVSLTNYSGTLNFLAQAL
ncbi:MAG: hypothetical protein R3B81_03570 [bacterium]